MHEAVSLTTTMKPIITTVPSHDSQVLLQVSSFSKCGFFSLSGVWLRVSAKLLETVVTAKDA